MITCSVCGNVNDDLAVLCNQCKSYVQAKVDNLNLFETVWGLIESPRATFKRIVLSQHKNYIILLSSLQGVSLLYTVYWYKNMGDSFSNVFTLLLSGFLLGPPLGLAFTALFSMMMLKLSGAMGGKMTLKNAFAIASYSSVPLVVSLVFVVPVEVAVFGIYFFSNNPPPIILRPVIYVCLVGLGVVAFGWSWLLLIEGTIVGNGFTRSKAFLLTIIAVGLTGVAALILFFV